MCRLTQSFRDFRDQVHMTLCGIDDPQGRGHIWSRKRPGMVVLRRGD
jgi:hypothetical protein